MWWSRTSGRRWSNQPSMALFVAGLRPLKRTWRKIERRDNSDGDEALHHFRRFGVTWRMGRREGTSLTRVWVPWTNLSEAVGWLRIGIGPTDHLELDLSDNAAKMKEATKSWLESPVQEERSLQRTALCCSMFWSVFCVWLLPQQVVTLSGNLSSRDLDCVIHVCEDWRRGAPINLFTVAYVMLAICRARLKMISELLAVTFTKQYGMYVRYQSPLN